MRLRTSLVLTSLTLVLTGCGAGVVTPLATTTPVASTAAPATPTATPTPTWTGGTPAPAPLGSQLPPGTYRSSAFATPLQFTVPAGWKVFEDELGQFGLALVANDRPCVCVWRDVRASSTADGCPVDPEPGVGTSAQAIADWLEANPGIAASGRRAVTVGGLKGVVLDIRVDPAWTKACPERGPGPKTPTLVGSAPLSADVAWDVSAGDSQRLYLLDLADGSGNIAINVDVCCGVIFERQTAAADAVISTFAFAS